jgi:uncharacterized protein YkwD
MLLLAAVICCGAAFANTAEPGLEATDAALINDARAHEGLTQLSVDPRLQAIAERHARGMAKRRSMKHNLDLGRDVRRAGLCWRVVGENVGWSRGAFTGDSKTQRLHTAYMGSPVHRENILNPAYRLVGVGVVKRHGTIWNVEDFAAPC